jgi:CheY-like chemotaxis protein
MITNIATELWRDGQLFASGICHLLSDGLVARGGTISRLRWLGAEPDLTDVAVEACLADGRKLPIRVMRHSQPEGRTVLRFTVSEARTQPARSSNISPMSSVMRRHALVVEPDPAMRTQVTHALRTSGWSVDAAVSESEAVVFAGDHPPNGVALDVRALEQPRLLAAELRMRCGRRLPILAMSSRADEALVDDIAAFDLVLLPDEIQRVPAALGKAANFSPHPLEPS